jgi:anthrone oxygenase-like protein
MTPWAAVLIISSGLFTGSVMAFAWDRVTAWRRMPLEQFAGDFDHTINKADKIQPALLVVAIASGVGYGLTQTGTARTLAFVSAGGFLIVLLASLAVLLPLQRRILRSMDADREAIVGMQRRWFSGHLGRTALSIASFIVASIAISVALT